MIVFTSSVSRGNIFAQDVFDKMRQSEIGQQYRPDLLLDQLPWIKIPKSIPDFLLIEIGERSTKDVFIYAFESVRIVTKKVYPTLSPHFPAWEFLNTSFLASTVQRDVETILRSPITLLTGTFVGVSLCAMDTFLRMLRQAPKWEFFVSRKRSHPSGPRAVFQGRFLCYHIQQLFFRNDHNLEYFQQWDWLQLHFLLGNTSVVQHVLSSKQMFAVKAELMALAHHEQQNGLSLSSKDLQDSGIYHSFIVKELSLLAELMQSCVDDANLSDASLLTPRM
ncbi:hypothetical protein ACFX2J_027524 [Malus domestica]